MKNFLTLVTLVITISVKSQNMVQANNWRPISIPLNGTDKLYFWSADSGFAYGNNNEAKLLATYDGGKSWHLKFDITDYTDSNRTYKSPIHIRNKKEIGIAFWDKDSLINFFKTKNGGTTWERHKSPKTVSQCYDMMYHGDTIAISSTPYILPVNAMTGYTAIQYSVNNFDDSITNVNYWHNIQFKKIDDNELYFITANTRMQGDGSEKSNAYGNFLFGISLDSGKVQCNPCGFHRLYYYYPFNKDITKGFYMTDWKLFKYPFNDLESDSFMRVADPGENPYRNLASEYPTDAFTIRPDKIAIIAYKKIFTVDGSAFNGGHLMFKKNEGEWAKCIYFGDSTTGYIGTNANYLLKSTKSTSLVSAGINELKETEVKLYPNPANESINIALTNTIDFDFFITDIFRRQVHHGKSHKFQTHIDVSFLNPGIYFLTIQSGDKNILVRKIIIQ